MTSPTDPQDAKRRFVKNFPALVELAAQMGDADTLRLLSANLVEAVKANPHLSRRQQKVVLRTTGQISEFANWIEVGLEGWQMRNHIVYMARRTRKVLRQCV